MRKARGMLRADETEVDSGEAGTPVARDERRHRVKVKGWSFCSFNTFVLRTHNLQVVATHISSISLLSHSIEDCLVRPILCV
jgi:hypothetical protein